MNRRGFLRLLGAAGAAAATNPVHFLAPIGGWKSDTIINPVIGQYADFMTFEGFSLAPAIDPLLFKLVEEMIYRGQLTCGALRRDTIASLRSESLRRLL